MKASEAYSKLRSVRLMDWHSASVLRSSVDETKTLTEMLSFWLHLFESNPDMRIGSIIQYNVKRDFHSF